VGWENLLGDADIGWHIRTGDWIIQNHAVPHRDLYSVLEARSTMVCLGVGSDVIFATLHRVAGLKGVVLLAGVLISVFCLDSAARMAGRGAHLLWGMTVALIGVGRRPYISWRGLICSRCYSSHCRSG